MLGSTQPRSWALGAAALAASSLLGCGDPDVTSDPGEPQGECNVVETRYQNGTREHMAECDETDYPMSPPVFGDHYPTWAAYQTYDFAVPTGFLVHDLEHGAVVFFYDCPDGCDDEIADVQAFIDDLPIDPLCTAPVERRTILVPRPGLGARWAAAAWGYNLTADCFDAELFRGFYERRVGKGPEDLCNQGIAFTASPCD